MEKNGWNLFIEVTKRIDKTLGWTLESQGRHIFVFDVILDSSPVLLTTISKQASLVLSVTVFENKEDIKDDQIIDDEEKGIQIISSSGNKENTKVTYDNEFTYALSKPEHIKLSKEEYEEYEEFKRFMKFIESVRDDLSKIKYDDIDLFYIYVIFPLIFPKAIEIGEDYLVEAIIDKCITYYNDNYSEYSPNILSIITTSYSKLCDVYPHYAKKFISTLTIYRDLKMDVTDNKKHLESYSDNTKNLKLIKFANYELNLHFFNCPLFEFSFTITLTILYLSFYLYDIKENVLIPLSLTGAILLFIVVFMGPQEVPSKTRKSEELLIPFTKFTYYPEPTKLTKSNFLKKLFLIPNELNEFIRNQYPCDYSVVSERQSRDLYSGWNGEALINFKWNHFAKFYYFIILFIYIIFSFFFFFSSTYLTKPLKSPYCMWIIDTMLGFFLLSFEVRKFIFNHKKYVWSGINYINLGAYIFPTVSSISYLVKTSLPVWMLSASFALLNIKMIFFLLPFKIFGSYLATIRYVSRRVFPFLLILFFLILTFADAFYILLRPKDPKNDSKPLLDNDPNNNNSKPLLDNDPYGNYNTSVLALYQLMTGNSDSLDSSNLYKDPALVILWVSYSFLIVIYLLNLFIGLLNNAIQEANGQEFFLFQKAEIIAEIELFWLLPYQRRWKEWFPDRIWYNVHTDDLRKKIQEIHKLDLCESDKPIIHPKLLDLECKNKINKQLEKE